MMMANNDEYHAEPLSEAECARLRPSVDVVALQRWLDATHDEVRVAVIAHFANMVTAQDLRAIGEAVGATAEELAAWDAPDEEPSLPGEWHIPGPDAPSNAVTFRSIPGPSQPVVWMEPPEDPILTVLWNAIEPSYKPGQ